MLEKIKAFFTALKMIRLFIEWVETFILKKRGNAKVDKAQKAADDLKEINKIEDDKKRLEEKAKKMKELEDAVRGS